MKVTHIKPPNRSLEQFDTTIFLAGAIDMGEAKDWQAEVVEYLEAKTNDNFSVGVFNPRRDDWDSSWSQEIGNAQFFEQVTWELNHINNCDIAVVYFTKDSKAPITLMELGKISELKIPENVIVFCPDGYHRKGNVDILCYLKGIAVHTDSESFYKALDRAVGVYEPVSLSEGASELVVNDSVEQIQEDFTEIEIFDTVEPVSFGDENTMVVSDYAEVNESSCMMGNIQYKDHTFSAGICEEDGSVKANLYFKKNGQRVMEQFIIRKVSEDHPEEKIIFAKNN